MFSGKGASAHRQEKNSDARAAEDSEGCMEGYCPGGSAKEIMPWGAVKSGSMVSMERTKWIHRITSE